MGSNGKSARLDTREKITEWFGENCGFYTPGLVEMFAGFSDNQVWHWRERQRFDFEVYRAPHWLKDFPHEGVAGWFLHIAATDPLKIAYTPSHEYGMQDRQVVTSVGKFLKKHYGDRLTDLQIRDWVDIHRSYHGEPVVWFAFGADDIQEVYHHGPSSCMGGSEHPPQDFLAEYPCRIYDGPDTALAFLKRDDEINARAVVRLDRTPMTFSRVYGDSLLRERLERLGFTHEFGLDGVRLRLARDSGRTVCPYLDGEQSVDASDDTWLRVGSGRDSGCCTNGFTARTQNSNDATCCCCGDDFDSDDGYSRWDDEPICEDCEGEYFVDAVYNRDGDHGLVHVDDTIEVNGTHYRNENRVLSANSIVERADGEYCHTDDVTLDAHGVYQDPDDVTYIAEYDAYYPCDEVCTAKGRDEPCLIDDCEMRDDEYVHIDDLEEYDAEQRFLEAQSTLDLEAA